MNRDHRKLEVFRIADELVVETYSCTEGFPEDEKYELRSQIRRAALSVPTNIVEGCARDSLREYIRFADIAFASACETNYLLDLAARLGYLSDRDSLRLARKCENLVVKLHRLLVSLRSIQ